MRKGVFFDLNIEEAPNANQHSTKCDPTFVEIRVCMTPSCSLFGYDEAYHVCDQVAVPEECPECNQKLATEQEAYAYSKNRFEM